MSGTSSSSFFLFFSVCVCVCRGGGEVGGAVRASACVRGACARA